MTDPTPLVIAPNLKHRHSGVTSTILRIVPLQARDIAIRATGPGLPPDIPHIPLRKVLTLPNDRWRVWHARRNTEMLMGLALRKVMRRKLKLIFTSAAQRDHSGYTKWLIRQMDLVIATSEKSARFLERPARVIRHGVDTEKFRPSEDKAALRARLGLPDGILIGCYGRVRHQKGVDLFIDALCRVLPDHPDAHGVVMGRTLPEHSEYLAKMKAAIREADLGDRVHFLDECAIDELPGRFAALDLYVAPQRWEGFGLTPLEAMACGVPVIATRVGAFEELIAPGETGRLVEIEDMDGIVAGLREGLEPHRRADWSTRCRAHVVDNFRIEDEAAVLNGLYRELLGPGPTT